MATRKKVPSRMRYLVVDATDATTGCKGPPHVIAEYIWQHLQRRGCENQAFNDEWLVEYILLELAIYSLDDDDDSGPLTEDQIVGQILISLWDVRTAVIERELEVIEKTVLDARQEQSVSLDLLRELSHRIKTFPS